MCFFMGVYEKNDADMLSNPPMVYGKRLRRSAYLFNISIKFVLYLILLIITLTLNIILMYIKIVF